MKYKIEIDLEKITEESEGQELTRILEKVVDYYAATGVAYVGALTDINGNTIGIADKE